MTLISCMSANGLKRTSCIVVVSANGLRRAERHTSHNPWNHSLNDTKSSLADDFADAVCKPFATENTFQTQTVCSLETV